MKGALAVALTMGLLPAPAQALTGAELYRLCTEPAKDSHDDIACLGYVRGFIDGWVLGGGIATEFPNIKICIPQDGVALDQGRLLLEDYLRAHPQQLTDKAGMLFGAALLAAYRCPTN